MDVETFIGNLSTLAEAPGGIGRLRELILDLASRGRLVEQDPKGGDARSLVESLSQQRATMIAQKALRHRKAEALRSEEVPFRIPPTWSWLRLPEAAHDLGQRKPEAAFTYIDVSAIDADNGRIGPDTEVVEAAAAPSRARKCVAPGAVLYSTVRPYLRNIAIVEHEYQPEAIASTAFAVLFPFHGIATRWIYLCVRSPYFTRYVEAHQKGVAYPAISDRDLQQAPLPLPPSAEQERIVARVDELMQLCDELDVRQQARATVTTQFHASALDALMNTETDTDLASAWSRVQDNWDTFTDEPDAVDGIRQAILELAVRGKLEPQDLGEEPADRLLDRCLQERNQVGQSRKLRLPRNAAPLDQIPKPFAIPAGWTWCRFTDVGILERGRSKHRPRNDPALYVEGTIPLIQTGDVARASGRITTYTALYNDAGVAQSRLWPEGTLCITIAANIADSALLGFEACFPDSVVGFVPFICIGGAKWFEFFMRTAKSHLDAFAPSTAQKNINLAILDDVLIPLPPLAEQRRIVAKVDELLQLCDELENRLENHRSAAERLAESVRHHLVA